MKTVCPECGAGLNHKRVDDGFETHRIAEDGTISFLCSNSEGYNEVTCQRNADHVIPQELVDYVVCLVVSLYLIR